MLTEFNEIEWVREFANTNSADDDDDAIDEIELQTMTNTVALEVLSSPLETTEETVLTGSYLVNGSIVCLTTAVQSFLNCLLHNNDIRQGDSANGLALLLDMVFADFSNKMVKGNWTEVDSVKKQAFVLLAYLLQAVACDMVASRIPMANNQALIVGQATIVAALNALGYLTAMISAGILNKHTYTKGERPSALQIEPPDQNARRGASGGLVALMAMGSAAANRLLIDPTSAMGIVLNMACSEIISKTFKTGQRAEDQTTNKIKLLAFYLFSAVAADAVIGLFIGGSLPLTSPWRYVSGTTIGACLSFVKVSAKALLDHDRVVEKGAQNQIKQDEKALLPKKPPSKVRVAIASIAAAAIPIVTITLNHIPYVNQSPTLSLAVKMVQHNANALAIGELFKLSTNTLQRVAISLAPAALAIGAELAANAIDPKNAGFSVLGVAAKIAASYCGMTLSGWLLGTTNSDDI